MGSIDSLSRFFQSEFEDSLAELERRVSILQTVDELDEVDRVRVRSAAQAIDAARHCRQLLVIPNGPGRVVKAAHAEIEPIWAKRHPEQLDSEEIPDTNALDRRSR